MILIVCIKGYQRYISALFPSCCRYYPTCSEYTLQAVRRYGSLRGGWLGFKRILTCHPYSRGGINHIGDHHGAY